MGSISGLNQTIYIYIYLCRLHGILSRGIIYVQSCTVCVNGSDHNPILGAAGCHRSSVQGPPYQQLVKEFRTSGLNLKAKKWVDCRQQNGQI